MPYHQTDLMHRSRRLRRLERYPRRFLEKAGYWGRGDLFHFFAGGMQEAQAAGIVGPPGSGSAFGDFMSSWMTPDAFRAVASVIVPVVGGALLTPAVEAVAGAVSNLIPQGAANVIDTIQPYVGGLNLGSIVPGAATQANPKPAGPAYNENTTFMNPPLSPDGYSTAAYQSRGRRRGGYRIMRRRRRY